MGTYTKDFVLNNATVEEFRTWIAAYLEVLAGAGVGRVVQAGQIDPLTATIPAASNTAAGYSLHYLDDSLHATAPVYFKIEYGRGAGAAVPMLWLTVGKGVDGSGNITGVLVARDFMLQYGHSSSQTMVASAGEGYLAFFPYATAPGDPFAAISGMAGWLFLERFHDPSGAPTDAGVVVASNTAGSGAGLTSVIGFPLVRTVTYGAAQATISAPPVLIPSSVNGVTMGASASLAQGGIGPVFPWVLFASGRAPFQVLNVVSIPPGDYPGDIFETTMGGIVRTYRPLTPFASRKGGLSLIPTTNGSSMGQAAAIAIRWEV